MIQQTTTRQRATRPEARFGEYYRSLAERVRGLHGADGSAVQTLGVTSCQSGEGVTTVALNLAVSAADIYQSPILVIDANLPRPAISHWLSHDQGPGLADVLMGSVEVADAISESSEANLSVLTAGTEIARTRASFDPSRLCGMLSALKSDYALIVIDLPPAVQASMCWNIAPSVDGLLLVVEADRVESQAAAQVKRWLIEAGANPLGVVLNKQKNTSRWNR